MTTPDDKAGRGMDAVVGRAIGQRPHRLWAVSTDGGKSLIAWVSRDGPWYSLRELEEWLADQKHRGYHTDAEIVGLDEWPNYSKDIADAVHALTVLGLPALLGVKWGMPDRSNSCTIALDDGEQVTRYAETLPLAIALAILAAKGDPHARP